MSDPNNKPGAPTDPVSPASAGPEQPSRRRLLGGSLAAGPVLLTLTSRPVLAGGSHNGGGGGGGILRCTTPSGFVSMNASTAGRGVSCSGRSAIYWKDSSSFSQWPANYYPTTVSGMHGHKATGFNDIFTPQLKLGTNTSPTLLDVLDAGSGGNNVARALVVALLNAASGLTPVLSVTLVKSMWSEYCQHGYFSPSSGAKWSAAELLDYLSTTQA